MEIHEEDYLEHYGKKGMKWGVRNDRKTLGVDMSQKVSSIKDNKSTKAGMSKDEQTLAIYGGLLVAALGYKAISWGIRQQTDSGKRDAKKTGDKEFKKNLDLTKKMSVDELHHNVVSPINPGYGEKGTMMNCRRATMAYEMRRRGNDVKATKSTHATGQEYKGIVKLTNTTKKPESGWGEKLILNYKTPESNSAQKKADLVFKSLSDNPDGARGELAVGWMFGGGHSVAWEVVNRKPVIFDTQNGKRYTNPSEFLPVASSISEAAQTRLDNKPIDGQLIKRWVTDV